MIRAFTRSFWQAYREQWGVLIVCMITMLCPVAVAQFSTVSQTQALFVGLTCPMLFILASSAMLLSGEREAGTLDRLRLMRPSPGGFLAGKLLWLLLGTSLFAGCSAVINLKFVPARGSTDVPNWTFFLCVIGAGWLEALGWGLVMTARCRSVFRALAFATTIVFLLGTFFQQSPASAGNLRDDVWRAYDWALVIRYFIAVAAVVLGTRGVLQQLRLPAEIRQARRPKMPWHRLAGVLVNPRHFTAIV